jgi:glycosyltransferase involved in cell wall biosynthesis
MLSRLLRDHGIRSDFFALNADLVDRLNLGFDFHIPYRMNPCVRRLREIYYLWTVLVRYDVIHFHFNSFLSLGNGWELEFLKKMGKVLVFHFRGCDLRQKSVNMNTNPILNCCQECEYPEGSCDNEYQSSQLAKARRYGDLFFVTTPDLKDFFPEAEHIPFISPYGIDLEHIQPAPKQNGVFRIVTSSNHPSLDGIPYVRRAVKNLQQEGYGVELVEVIGKPFREAISIYKSADLYAGKLRMGYYNNANIETMMMGVPNISYIREEYLKNIPGCPIIIAKPGNIYETIKKYLDQPEQLKAIGARGPDFVREYHNPDKIIGLMIQRYNEAFSARKNFH